MKKRCTCFLRMQRKMGMPLLAVACLSVAGSLQSAEPAAAKAAPAPVKSAPAAEAAAKAEPAAPVKALVMERTREVELITEMIRKAKNAYEKDRDLQKALALLDEADSKIADSGKGANAPLAYLDGVKAISADARKDITTSAAETMLGDANSLYLKARRKGMTAEAAKTAEGARKLATDARFLYYLGNVGTKVNPADLEKAINSKNMNFSVRVEQVLQRCGDILSAGEFRNQTSRDAVDGRYQDRQREIAELYAKAQKLYTNKQYTMARDLCEAIFVEDPYNQNAIRLLDKIYKQMYFYAELRNYNELLRNDAETIWDWTPGIAKIKPQSATAMARRPTDPLMEKLTSIEISVDFKDYTVTDAINKIRELSKEKDPARIGVNFLPKGLPQDKTVTLELDNVPIANVLNYLCKKTGITWTTDRETFVLIGTGIGDYENLEIPMRNSVYSRITNKEEGDTGSSSSGGEEESIWGEGGIEDGGVGAGASKQAKISDEDLKKFFQERGVTFEGEATIAYNRNAHLLSVRNTRENLLKLETLVREMDVENPLVLIEAKILEIGMNDQEVLGFDWTVDYANDKNDTYAFTMESPLRELASSVWGKTKLINNLNIIPNMNLDGGHQFNVYLTVTAVDRTDRIEILSTPKVISRSGEEANIKMVQQMYFPESWSEPDTSNVNGTSMEFEPSYPEFGDPEDVGISFTVTPTVSANNKVVTLSLLPSVTDLTGWSDYNYEVIMGQKETLENGEVVESENITSEITLKMPIISKREISTMLKVFDGQTVLIGGLTVDRQTSLEDKFPILGDLPILGRFFTKKAEKTERSNLLISVATRLISGDGVPINSNVATGVPDFRR